MKIPEYFDPLVQLLENAADGANKYGAAIGLKQNVEAGIRADLAKLVGTPAGPGGVPPAVPGLKTLWNTAKANKTRMSTNLAIAEANGRALATTCIATLKPVLGMQWNSAWNEAGFISGSLAVPTHPQSLLLLLSGYYTNNPSHEVRMSTGLTARRRRARRRRMPSWRRKRRAIRPTRTRERRSRICRMALMRAGRGQ